MKKLFTLTCLITLLLFSHFAFRTIAPIATTSATPTTTPVICGPSTNNLINAVAFDAKKYLPQALMVRKNVYSLSSSEIDDIKRGIIAMRALPTSDPTSWTYQAAIHGTSLTNNLTSWNTCQHGTQFFYSWHRMYLYFFERILRAKSGNPNLTLPYWDYQTNPVIPPAYRDNSSGNPLYDKTRFSSMNSGGSLPSSISSSINTALNNLLFYDFQNRMENPHGAVHDAIGGNMGKIKAAAVDPVFYLHHANIDRLWEVWLWKCQGRSSPNSSDATWWNKKYTFFDENGKAVVMTASQIVDIAAQLNYRYDTPEPYTTTTTTTTTGGSGSIPSPGKFEAENYIAKFGISTVTITDEGVSGKAVNGISNRDWMDYTVTIPEAATYTVNFRVANGNSTTGNLQLLDTINNVTRASISIPNTGGASVYTTLSTTATFPAGTQRIRIYAGVGGWTINWFSIISLDGGTTTTTTTTPCGTTSRTSQLAAVKTSWKSYEMLRLPSVTRLNQKSTQLPLAASNQEGTQLYLTETHNRPFQFSHKADADQLTIDIELLQINKVPEGIIEVYLNLPNGTTPSSNSNYFAGLLPTFGATEHIHHNEKSSNIITLDASAAAAAQGLSPNDLSKAKLTFVVRGDKLPNGTEVQTAADVQIGTIAFKLRKAN